MHSGPAVGVDVGGTFTDVVLHTGEGVVTAKVPTTTDQSEGVLAGLAAACEAAGIDPADVASFRHATTVATNAMLERDGARTALVTTEGFRDVLAIGRQDRPELYDQSACRPAPLVPRDRRFELAERATPAGIENRVDDEAVRSLAADLPDDVESVAISFLHAYAHPENERRVAERLREGLDVPVLASHETLPTFREYERTATTVVDAYVTPVLRSYLDSLLERLQEADVVAPRIM